MRFARLSVFISAFALAVLSPGAALAQSALAGNVGLLNGQAQATSLNGPAHALAKGDSIYGGDIVETGPSSYAMIRFTDQGSVLLRPNSKFQVEKYKYSAGAAPAAAAAPAQREALAPLQAAAANEPDSTFFRLLKGGLRAVSGLVAHADYSHYLMSTPVATMGIRGTDYELAMCEETCQGDATVQQAVPAGKSLVGAVVSGVNQGQIVVTSFTGNSVTLSAGQAVITLADGSQYLLAALPAFLTTDAEAVVVDGGVAAGGASAAAAAAGGSVLVGVGVTASIAAVIGVVVSSSSSSNSTATATSTSTAH